MYESLRMNYLTVNIIGAGKLGKTIGCLLVKSKLIKIGAVCNTTFISSHNAIKFIGDGTYSPDIAHLPPADITFITTPDDKIANVCKELHRNQFITAGKIVLHCSGSLTSEVLNSLKEKHCFVASAHPMHSFAEPEVSIKEYEGTYCALEGDEQAILKLKPLFDAIGSNSYQINKDKKSLYHAAGVFASNYLITLSQQALSCMHEAGVEDDMALDIILNIMKGSLFNLENMRSSKNALTGPLKRGDISTVKKHLNSFQDVNQKKLYSVLGQATLDLTDIENNVKEKLQELFENNE